MNSYDVVVIGSGFGGTMTALTLAQRLKDRKPKILILERGTWWTTPVSTVQDKTVRTFEFLKSKGQPVQYWSSAEHLRGFIDILLRCVRRPKNEDGLYDLMHLGRRGFLGIGAENDGVSILRACGVGGGSLVYSNITLRPPDFVLEDARWPLTWSTGDRDKYFDLARHAIGYGVVSAWTEFGSGNIPYRDSTGGHAPPKGAVNAGLSNIVTRSARLNPQWAIKDDLKRIDPTKNNAYWIDRARIFQTALSEWTALYGTVDSSINDVTPEGTALDPGVPQNYPGAPINYCERQGRCNVGCLPGARHTLNKQLMRAIFGKASQQQPQDGPQFDSLSIETLAEVDIIRALPTGGYEIEYWKRNEKEPSQKTALKLSARRVIVAAGCLGTNEILLRSRDRGGLPNLGDKLGFGFSTNGDYIAFAEDLREPDGSKRLVSLTRGPVTTSVGHFQTPDARLRPEAPVDTNKFHTVEDQGIPRSLASTLGFGMPLMRRLATGQHHHQRWLTLITIALWAWHRLIALIASVFKDASERQDAFKSEDEFVHNMMCLVSQGREASVGQFRLGKGSRESPLRVTREDKKKFWEDPIYDEIRATLSRLAPALGSKKEFIDPFLGEGAQALVGRVVTTTHPLGGCRMGRDVQNGVVDEFGRVFDKSKTGARAFYEGLYVADGAIMPTALGVNPSLTISALALRIADNIVKEFP